MRALGEVPTIGPMPEGTGPLRASSYTISVDLKEAGDPVLLVHTYAGAFSRVSPLVADYVGSLGVKGPRPRSLKTALDGRTPSDATIEQLMRRGFLTTMTVEQEQAYFTRIVDAAHTAQRRGRPTYVLLLTYDCNLRCTYCYQSDLREQTCTLPEIDGSMSPAMVDRLWKAMDDIEAAHGTPSGQARAITLYGGEPFLDRNRPAIEQLLRRADADGGAKITAVSNGTNLHEFTEYLGPGKVTRVQITLDGMPALHDVRRIKPDGTGSFDETARGISATLAAGAHVAIRINVDRDNVEQLPALTKEFERRGWHESSSFSVYAAPVHESPGDEAPDNTMSSLQLKKMLGKLGEHCPDIERIGTEDGDLLSGVRNVLDNDADPLHAFSSTYCGAHTRMYVFDPFGDIYPCWEKTGAAEFRAGIIDPEGRVLVNESFLEAWRGRSIASNDICASCAYSPFCGGGCAMRAEGKTGDLYTPFCDGFARRFEDVVVRAYTDHCAGKQKPEKPERVSNA